MSKLPPPEPHASFSPSFEYLATLVLSWLVPGAGHWLLGYRVRALLLSTCILGLFWVGESLLAENMAVSRKVSPVFFALQAGNGLSSFAADHFWGTPRRSAGYTESIDRELSPNLNLGILFTLVSGLLNVLLLIHTMDPRTWLEAAMEKAERGRRRASLGAEGGP
jgi:hypothetical protein